jgi:hypothetical protein
MSISGKGPSRKFRSTTLMERLVPVILVLLALIMVGTLAIVILSLLGLLPTF